MENKKIAIIGLGYVGLPLAIEVSKNNVTTGLDIDNRLRLSEHLHRLAKSEKCGVFWCTHIPDELWPDDNVVIMKKGQKVFAGSFGSIDELMGRYNELVSAS